MSPGNIAQREICWLLNSKSNSLEHTERINRHCLSLGFYLLSSCPNYQQKKPDLSSDIALQKAWRAQSGAQSRLSGVTRGRTDHRGHFWMCITMLPICTTSLPEPNLPFQVLPQPGAIRHHLLSVSPVVFLGYKAISVSTASHRFSIAVHQVSTKMPPVSKPL